MDIFDIHKENKEAPLAWRMQPRSMEEFVGQEHILGDGKLLRRAIEADRISSVIFYGPPGTGKTALAHIIAKKTQAFFIFINAVTSGIADIREVIAEAKRQWFNSKRRTILFIDEIHRFNRIQQDALLPDVEEGNIILIGASTHNPFFSIIPPLSSRSQIFQFKPLSHQDIRVILERALNDKERGMGNFKVKMEERAIEHLIVSSEGDARKALNALEIGILSTGPDKNGVIIYDQKVAEESIQKKVVVYNEDAHYDTISAFIKSLRGSDPDAAIYWLAKMIYAGEDPLFIARRMIIAASEDVGNADPNALSLAISAFHAVESIGMPEGRIPLAQAAIYIATAPKSNASYTAIESAMKDVEEGRMLQVPDHLKDSHYRGATRLGAGIGYKYPHNYPGHHVNQSYMPEKRHYYNPSDEGYEKEIKNRLKGNWRKRC
ncbi:MAG: replication-associated recombination protein A [Nitrospirota bacterium]